MVALGFKRLKRIFVQKRAEASMATLVVRGGARIPMMASGTDWLARVKKRNWIEGDRGKLCLGLKTSCAVPS